MQRLYWIFLAHTLRISIVFCGLLCALQLRAESPEDLRPAQRWADSVLNTLNWEQKIGQLFMVAAYSNKDERHTAEVLKYIEEYHVGGLIFMQGEAEEQVSLTRTYQRAARIPLLIGQDAEWGLGMRLRNTVSFPQAMTLGAIQDDSLIYHLGIRMGEQLRRLGVHINFAPVADINNNPANPVINYRSFGENKYQVSRKALMLGKGMMRSGVLACMKHFPGHGDTETDSHVGLPVMSHSLARLDTLELYPFAAAIRANMPAIMVGHLAIPALDPALRPATLSQEVVNELLRKRMQFDGLIFTDALNMRGVVEGRTPEGVILDAFKAGNDVLLFPENLPLAVYTLKKALLDGDILQWDINSRVKRMLVAKYQAGLNRPTLPSPNGIFDAIDDIRYHIYRKKLYESAITLAKNDQRLLPFQNLEQRSFAYLQIGDIPNNAFLRTLQKYAGGKVLYLPEKFTPSQRQKVMQDLLGSNTVVVGLSRATGAGRLLPAELQVLLGQLANLQAEVAVCIMGSPYLIPYVERSEALVVAYENTYEAQEAAASALFGGIRMTGRLPVTAGEGFPSGTGIALRDKIRFGFAYPEEVGVSGTVLAEIDSMIKSYLQAKAFPGCAVLVMRGDDIIFEKGYGYTHTGGAPIDPLYHTYDLASVTKIAATTIGAMRLLEQGIIELDKPIGYYLPELKGTDKEYLTIRRLLLHNAGLSRGILAPVKHFLDKKTGLPSSFFYSRSPTPSHTQPVSRELYLHPSVQDTVWKYILKSPVRNTGKVLYTDLGMIILHKILASRLQEPVDAYMQRNFYAPLGMNQTLYNPALQGRAAFCPPTEIDNSWRYTTVQGYVHDPLSALMGGVAGNAGLFSSVYDMAKLMTMLKNGGNYGKRYYLDGQTIDVFTQRQLPDSRRALGFDKPEIEPKALSPVSRYASMRTFGHQGFTGTGIWTDPENDLVYIFLSNRTYPNVGNRMFAHEQVRSTVMDKIYEAMAAYKLSSRYSQSWTIGGVHQSSFQNETSRN